MLTSFLPRWWDYVGRLEVSMSQKSSSGSQGHSSMTSAAGARIQSATAKSSGGQVAKGSFAARAQSAAARGGGKGGGGKR